MIYNNIRVKEEQQRSDTSKAENKTAFFKPRRNEGRKEKDMIRLADEVVERLQEQAKRYGEDEFQRFIDEIGWEDWMNDFTEDSENMTENEISVIDDILMQIFESVR